MGARAPAPDQAARDAAARDLDATLVVVAGAGSGKTTLLVERMLMLCLARDVRLCDVAAITFTEKAAAEMRERLANQLSALVLAVGPGDGASAPARLVTARERLEALEPLPLPAVRCLEHVAETTPPARLAGVLDTLRERALLALEDLESGVASTVHAFCAEMLRRHPVEARLAAGFAIEDRGALRGAFDAEWEGFEAEELGASAPRRDAWERVLRRADLGAVRRLALALFSLGRDVSEASPAEAADRVRGMVGRAVLGLETARPCLGGKPGRSHQWIDAVAAALRDWLQGGARGLERGLAAAEAAGANLDRPPTVPKACEDADRVAAALREADRLVKALRRVEQDLVGDALEVVRPLVERVHARAEREGLASFNRLIAAARDLLRDHPQVREEEKRRVAALLLDELQDTNPLQYEIAFFLAEKRGRSARDAWSAELEPGRLFVVGDPKQSIYRFQGADMASYERAVARLGAQGARTLTLTANFRSVPEVLGPVNALCGHAIREESPYQPAYVPIVPAPSTEAAGEARVEVWTTRHDGTGADAARAAEARALARQLAAWAARAEGPRPRDVAVLFRSMTDAPRYQQALDEAGVPYVVHGSKSFAGRDEVRQALLVLRCLAYPSDEPALLGVLRSTCCAADDAEIVRYGRLVLDRLASWSWRGAARRAAELPADVRQVASTLAGLEELARRIARMPADAAVREVLGASGPGWGPRLLELNAAASGAPQRLANLEKLVESAALLARDEGLSLPRVVARLEETLAEDVPEGESPLADEHVEAVKLMTVHQAKGLEYPVVVIVDVARQESRRPKAHVAAIADGLLAVKLAGARAWNLAAVAVDASTRRHEEAEAARVLYVAATRARDRLVFLNGNLQPKDPGLVFRMLREAWGYDPQGDLGRLAGGTVVHRVLEDAEVELVTEPAPDLSELVAAVRQGEEAARRLAASAAPPIASARGAWPGTEGLREVASAYEPARGGAPEGEVTDEAPEPRGPRRADAPDLARAVGISVHRALEAWDLGDAGALLGLALRAAALAEVETGVARADVASSASALLSRLAGSPLVARLRRAQLVARELPFVLERDGAPWQGVIDLVLVEDGAWWVADWKTDRDLDPERHREQLAVYAEAVRRWRGLGSAPGQALLDVVRGSWVTVHAPSG
jgi:ATP-dependent helicase/nuclease subunit A